jgi:hypothetical protein
VREKGQGSIMTRTEWQWRDAGSGSGHTQLVHANGQQETDSLPLDRETMRAATRRLLGPDAQLPAYEEVETLTLLYRGNLMLLIPEVDKAACGLPKDDVPRACALACIGEARIRLDLEPGTSLPATIAHAQRLARSVQALCDHLANLSGERP